MNRPNPGKEKLLVNVRYIRTAPSSKAILVTEGLKNSEGEQIEHWLPLSQIDVDEDTLEPGKTCDVAVPRWLCEEKGLTIG